MQFYCYFTQTTRNGYKREAKRLVNYRARKIFSVILAKVEVYGKF